MGRRFENLINMGALTPFSLFEDKALEDTIVHKDVATECARQEAGPPSLIRTSYYLDATGVEAVQAVDSRGR